MTPVGCGFDLSSPINRATTIVVASFMRHILKKMFICFDGEYVNPSKLRSSCFLGALQTCIGIFETIRVNENIPEYLGLHLARLNRGARFIRVPFPDVNYEFLIKKLLKRNSLSGKLAKLKIIVFPDNKGICKPVSEPARIPPAQRKTAHFCMTLEPYAPPARDSYSTGVKLLTAKHPYCESEIAKVKSICRLPYIRLREKTLKRGYFDCLLTDADGKILETTICNLFIWDGKEFFIPPVSSQRLRGIMERMVIKKLKASGFRVVEKNIKLAELSSKKGLLLTNSLIGVMPVRAIGKITLKDITGDAIIMKLVRKFS